MRFDLKTPSHWAERGDPYDCSSFIGPLESDRPWEMYSYERPGSILWNAIARALHERGWTDDEIKHWLQSSTPRHCLDASLGESLMKLGQEYAKTITKD